MGRGSSSASIQASHLRGRSPASLEMQPGGRESHAETSGLGLMGGHLEDLGTMGERPCIQGRTGVLVGAWQWGFWVQYLKQQDGEVNCSAD